VTLSVLHLCEGDYTGGAARGAINLHLGLLNNGVRSVIFFSGSCGDIPYSRSLMSSKWLYFKYRIYKKLNYFIKRIIYKNNHPFNLSIFGLSLKSLLRNEEFDIIHLHNINNFINLREDDIKDLNLFWTLRDLWSITGGCHAGLSINCHNYRDQCHNCKLLLKQNKIRLRISNFLLSKQQDKKAKILKIARALTLSDWQWRVVKHAGYNTQVIGNSVNVNIFQKHANARKSQNIFNVKDKILCIGGTNIMAQHKGGDILLNVLRDAKDIGFKIISFGRLANEDILGLIDKSYGEVTDDHLLSEIYSMSDIYLTLSRMDVFGKTVVEAMLCGTPVMAFDNSGPSEILRKSQAGVIISSCDMLEIKEALKLIYRSPKEQFLTPKQVHRIKDEYSAENLAKKHLKLYLESHEEY